MFRSRSSILLLSIGIALAGILLSAVSVPVLPLTGIDDAEISFVYSRNLAAGAGWVYTPGFERVEGATSFAWTAINSVAFALSAHPTAIIFAVAVLLCVASIYFCLRIYDLLLFGDGRRSWLLVAATIAFLVLLPEFYVWTTWSLMDVGIWSAAFLCLVWLIVGRLVGRIGAAAFIAAAVPAAAALVLIRPEGMAVAPGLLVLGGLLDWRSRRRPATSLLVLGMPLIASVVAAAGLIAFRLAYFGYPVPNTFYAKVSSMPLDNLKAGMVYFAKFAAGQPLVAVLLGALALLLWGQLCWLAGRRAWASGIAGDSEGANAAGLFLGIAIAGVLAMYIGIGGDHFGSFRFYQPIYPLLALPALLLLKRVLPAEWETPRLVTLVIVAAMIVGYAQIRMDHYRRANFMTSEMQKAREGRDIALTFNEIAPRVAPFTLGVTAAGGTQLYFNGRVWDLLGLNWVEMAHATTRRAGIRDHSAFAPGVFWAARPTIVSPSIERDVNACPREVTIDPFIDIVLDHLLESDRFRAEYAPFCMATPGGILQAYGQRSWLKQARSVTSIILQSWPGEACP